MRTAHHSSQAEANTAQAKMTAKIAIGVTANRWTGVCSALFTDRMRSDVHRVSPAVPGSQVTRRWRRRWCLRWPECSAISKMILKGSHIGSKTSLIRKNIPPHSRSKRNGQFESRTSDA